MKKAKVKSLMSAPLVTVPWNLPLAAAKKIMKEKRIRHVPVMGSQGELAGILSDRDLSRAVELIRRGAWDEVMVGDVMSWPVSTVDQKTPLVKAVKIMMEEKISALVVTKGDAVVGIVTSEDMLRVLQEVLMNEKGGRQLSVLDFTYDPLWRQMVQSVGAVGI